MTLSPSVILSISTASLLLILWGSPAKGFNKLLTPSALGGLVLYSIFCIRPLLAQPEDFQFYGYDAGPGSSFASGVGLVAQVTFALGCVVARTLRTRERQSAEAVCNDLRTGAIFRLLLLAVGGCAAYVVLLTALGGPQLALQSLSGGRSSDLKAAFGGLPTVVAMVSYMGSAAATSLIAMRAKQGGKLRAAEGAAILAAIGLSFAFNLSGGNRRALIPILLVPLTAWIITTGRRMRLRAVLALALALLFFVTLPFVRSVGARPDQNILEASVDYAATGGLRGLGNDFFLSYDTEMFNYISFVGPRLGGTIPYGGGRATAFEFLVFPLPQTAVLGTPYSEEVLLRLFNGGCGDPFCPVPSAPGVLLMDFGIPGVAMGMFALGLAARSLERVALSGSVGTRGVIGFAIMTGYAPVLMRTYSVHAVWWALYFGAFTLFCHWVLVKRSTKAQRGGSGRVVPMASSIS